MNGSGVKRLCLIIIVGIVLLLAGQGWLIMRLPDLDGGTPPPADEPEFPQTEPAPDSAGFISVETLKKYAQEFYVNTEFLNLIFPDKIVYKRAGVIYYADVDPTLAKHDYDWQRLTRLASRPVYADEAGGMHSLLGIDVSFYQESIDWNAVAGDGIDFAMIRLGYRGYGTGALVLDERFLEYMAGATQAGLEIGIYFFSQAVNTAEAEEEADFVLAALEGYNVSFPIVYDFEEIAGANSRADYLGKEQVTDDAIAFCERIAAAGYTPMIYANPGWFIHEMELPRLEGYEKWIAQYYDTPFFPYKFSLWQYSDSGTVAGIRGDVDMNLAFRPAPNP
ncbi:MAG: Lyzozyme M1 (1,4-beta-N-acetylmuramidase) [Gracilibacteraceae bacterium]|jgi:GH25 family lysozyme M1 (1,4-beta-N-acetylmuramidase)|nr:Lyzozyme M1 (1,4-beta-N-acetylmuramidase) [Gracilibacteraceae bacterium]